MVVILFRSMLTPEAGADYRETTEALFARASEWPGFVAVKDYTGADGERLTVVWWKDAASLRTWREDPTHVAAQERGRERWYEWYEMDVAEVVRESRFSRAGERDRFGPAA